MNEALATTNTLSAASDCVSTVTVYDMLFVARSKCMFCILIIY